jgi:polyphenol oxidase
VDAGVARIGVDPRCTVEEKSLFSHRRDPGTGRLAGVVWMEP